jgi:hypothetical protein
MRQLLLLHFVVAWKSPSENKDVKKWLTFTHRMMEIFVSLLSLFMKKNVSLSLNNFRTNGEFFIKLYENHATRERSRYWSLQISQYPHGLGFNPSSH